MLLQVYIHHHVYYLRYNISKDQLDSFTGTHTEVIAIYGNLNVGMTVDVFEYLLQQIEQALETGKDGMGYLVFLVTLELLLNVGQYDAYELYDCYD